MDAPLINHANYFKRNRLVSISFIFLLFLAVFVFTIYDFLAISRPVKAELLVVEGWIWDSNAMREAADEFSRGHYERLITVGGPTDSNTERSGGNTEGDLAAERLEHLGVDKNLIFVLPVPHVATHRTYAAALTLKKWMKSTEIDYKRINIFTLGTHARKSLLLFQRALGPGVTVGVIAGTEDTFEARYWWASAREIYVVMRKTLGYIYAALWPLPGQIPSIDA